MNTIHQDVIYFILQWKKVNCVYKNKYLYNKSHYDGIFTVHASGNEELTFFFFL